MGLAGTPMRRPGYRLSVIVSACLSSPGSKDPLASLSYIAIRDNKSARKPSPILAYSFRLIKPDGTRISDLEPLGVLFESGQGKPVRAAVAPWAALDTFPEPIADGPLGQVTPAISAALARR